ncbi:hypothetical protein ACHAWF_009604 [Thalassiosira exigua]
MAELCSLAVALLPLCSTETSQAFVQAMKESIDQQRVSQDNDGEGRNIVLAVSKMCATLAPFENGISTALVLPEPVKKEMSALLEWVAAQPDARKLETWAELREVYPDQYDNDAGNMIQAAARMNRVSPKHPWMITSSDMLVSSIWETRAIWMSFYNSSSCLLAFALL